MTSSFKITRALPGLLAIILGTIPPHASGSPIDDIASNLVKSHADAVVTLSAVIEVTVDVTDRPSQSNEETVELAGTVFSRDGWIVCSYTNTKPQLQIPPLPDGIKVDINTEVKEVRIFWGNGEETPATVVFNDPDLDLSIVRPDESVEVDSFVAFEEASRPDPKLLDEIVLLARQDESLDRLPAVQKGRLTALIEHPRRMFVANIGIPGTPAFDANGQVLGLFSQKRSETEPPALIVFPADEVAEALQKARSDEAEAGSEPESISSESTSTIGETGRTIVEENRESVVSLLAVVERKEQKSEVNGVGVIVGDDGLIATSRTGVGRGDINEIKIIMDDGSELEGKMVMEDLELDLAFILPDPSEVKDLDIEFTAASLTADFVELHEAETVLILTRESTTFFRQPRIAITFVDSVVDKPRRYYRTPKKSAGALAFDASGRAIGIYARRVNGEETRHRMVLPASHVLEAAARARKAAEEGDAETPSSNPDAPDRSDATTAEEDSDESADDPDAAEDSENFEQ